MFDIGLIEFAFLGMVFGGVFAGLYLAIRLARRPTIDQLSPPPQT